MYWARKSSASFLSSLSVESWFADHFDEGSASFQIFEPLRPPISMMVCTAVWGVLVSLSGTLALATSSARSLDSAR